MVGRDTDEREEQDRGAGARRDALGDGQCRDGIRSERQVRTVLLDTADDDERRPRLGEGALGVRLRQLVQIGRPAIRH